MFSLDGQYDFQVNISYVAARQQAIELAMIVDDDFDELGIECPPYNVALLGDDKRLPLYWVGPSDAKESGAALLYECIHVL